jgi:polyisoprenoid-binding protein YceI
MDIARQTVGDLTVACYRLDPRDSRFTVQAFASGALAMFAHSPVIAIREFAGELRLDPETGAVAALQVTVKADSLQVTGNVRPEDRDEIETRLRQEVLETATYPEIVYQNLESAATRVTPGWFRLHCRGRLTLHGLTNPLEMDVQLRVLDNDVRLSSEFALPQSAYRIKRVTALAGMITVKDELKLSYDVVGHRAM